MKNSFLLKCAIAICIPVIAISCIKNTKEQSLDCEPAPVAVLPFNVLDSTTGQDLFFAASPRYPTNSIYFFNIKDKLRKDTIRPVVAGTGNNRVFTVPVTNAVTQDTLLMKIAANTDDVIIYNFKNGTGECPYLSLDKLSLNGTTIVSSQGKYVFTK